MHRPLQSTSRKPSPVRRLDHVAVVVRDTNEALGYFAVQLGLEVVHSEVNDTAGVRLTYLDAGNAFVQLVEPLDADGELARWLAANGEGVHHVCFGADDPVASAAALALPGAAPPSPGSGRDRVSSFVPGPLPHGVRIECTEFIREEDVDATAGWLA